MASLSTCHLELVFLDDNLVNYYIKRTGHCGEKVEICGESVIQYFLEGRNHVRLGRCDEAGYMWKIWIRIGYVLAVFVLLYHSLA